MTMGQYAGAVPYMGGAVAAPSFNYGGYGAVAPYQDGQQWLNNRPGQVTPQVKTHNPFKAPGTLYQGEIGHPNDLRSGMRPTNDKLDRLVQICVEKMDFSLAQMKALTEDTTRMQQEIVASHHGGDPELRVQLVKANKEIHRLRTVLCNLPGSVLDDEPEDDGEDEGDEEESPEVEDPVF